MHTENYMNKAENVDTQTINSAPVFFTADDIGKMMRLSRKTVLNNIQHQNGFPLPLRGSKRPLLWDRAAVMEYLYSNQ